MENSLQVPTTTASRFSNRNLLMFIGISLLLIVLVTIVVYVMVANKDGNQTPQSSLPSQVCPDSTQQIDGKMQAIYKGKNYNLSQADQQWIQENCSDKTVPQLANLGIAIDNYDVNTGRAGSFVFNNDKLASNWPGNKIFFEFGAPLPSGVVAPEFGYMQIDRDTDILAMAAGKVVTIEDQPSSKDFALTVLINDTWALNYDHITELKVKQGDQVSAGQILGKPAVNRDGITGYIEIQIQQGDGRGKSTSYCPTDLLAPELKDKYVTMLKKLMADWEKLVADTGLYNEANHVTAGCVAKTVME